LDSPESNSSSQPAQQRSTNPSRRLRWRAAIDTPLAKNELGRDQLARLLDLGRRLVAELDLEVVLGQVLEAARELTGARYAALGILDQDKRELERFLFVGIDEETRARIGPLPRGHGLLGELIRNPEPLRLSRISDHPRSYGFPAGHPPMTTFVGAPVMIRGEVFGNLYLTDKAGDEFDEADEEMLVVLSEWAAIAIENARLYQGAEDRRMDLERAVRGLEATVSLSRELGGESDLDRVLELTAKRGRALVDARAVLILLDADSELTVAEFAGDGPAGLRGVAVEPDDALLEVMDAGTSRRWSGATLRFLDALGLDAASVLLVPLRTRGRANGAIVALDRLGRPEFSRDDELVLGSFGSAAAAAVAVTQALETEKLELSIHASEGERGRWARELHDETLQELGALKVMQESAVQTNEPEVMRRSLVGATEQVEGVIAGLERMITELRPAALDRLGIEAAIESLIATLRERDPLRIDADFDLDYESGREQARHVPELEAAIYRIVQEGLNNVIKHADAETARVAVTEGRGEVKVVIEDDGKGIRAEGGRQGFGLIGMRERASLVGGELTVGPGASGGTRVTATLPASRREPEGTRD
jgi:signal transduction histidine kinase